MFPPPVVFPATREVMEGYKTVSILHISQRCTHTLSSQPLCMKLLITWIKTYSIFDYCHHLQPTKLISTHITTILHFIFETQSILISPLTNISAARPQLQPCVLQSSAAGSLQSPVSVNTRLWPLIGQYLDTGLWLVTGHDGLKTTTWPLENCSLYSSVWNYAMKEIFQEMRGYHISWPIDIW